MSAPVVRRHRLATVYLAHPRRGTEELRVVLVVSGRGDSAIVVERLATDAMGELAWVPARGRTRRRALESACLQLPAGREHT